MTLPEPKPDPQSTVPKLYALVPCAGIGARAGTAGPKQYASLAGQPMVARTLDALSQVTRLTASLVLLAPQDTRFELLLPAFGGPREWTARCGGQTRAQTVAHGLDELLRRGAADQDWVLVHDAARCLLQPAWVDRLIDACLDDAVGGLLAVPLADTIKREVSEQASHQTPQRAQTTVDRRGMWAAQTPQMFRIGLLRQALQAAQATGIQVTDESSAVEALGLTPRLVLGDPANFKLTFATDFQMAEQLLRNDRGMTHAITTRIGEGWDIHQLVSGRALVLGGVTIPHSHGLLGHSDADALAHAITDAVLGGAGLGDIGQHFPDTDRAFKGVDSMRLLAEAARRALEAGWSISNIDATVIAQAPKLAPHIGAMRDRLATTLGLPVAAVNVKAKTAEQMGPVGEGRAIEARAVCLLTGSA